MSGALEEATVDGLQDEVDRTALLGEIRVQINRFVIEKPHQKNPQFWLDHVLEGLYLLLVRTDRSEKHLVSAATDPPASPRPAWFVRDLASPRLYQAVLLKSVKSDDSPPRGDGPFRRFLAGGGC